MATREQRIAAARAGAVEQALRWRAANLKESPEDERFRRTLVINGEENIQVGPSANGRNRPYPRRAPR
jgi:hypothetical protein